MIHPFLEVGGLFFWIISAIFALVVVSEIQSEKIMATSLTVLIYIAAFVLLTTGGSTVVAYLQAHPWYILYGFLGYLLGGCVWATLKWRLFFLPNLFDKYDTLRNQYLAQKGINTMPADKQIRTDFSRFAINEGVDIQRDRMVSRNKGRITAWLAYWPFSLLGTFFGDFLTRLFKSLYQAIAGLLQRLSDNMASKYSELDS